MKSVPLIVTLLILGASIYLGQFRIQYLERNSLPPNPVEKEIPFISSVEILNGCGVPGLASSMASYLRKNRFDVKSTDNAYGPDGGTRAYNYEKTLVISRIPETEMANKVAQLLGVSRATFIRIPHSSYDITVIIGHNYRELTYDN